MFVADDLLNQRCPHRDFTFEACFLFSGVRDGNQTEWKPEGERSQQSICTGFFFPESFDASRHHRLLYNGESLKGYAGQLHQHGTGIVEIGSIVVL